MATQVASVNKVKSGMCPHGLPPGACPICSNMGGGGSLRAGERPQKAGEMSYHECVMAGIALRAKKQAVKNHQINLEHRIEILRAFEANLQKISINMLEFASQISTNILLKPVAFIVQNIIVPLLNFIKSIPIIITKFIDKFNFIKEKLVDIMDKLTAIFGEVKAFIEKKISEFVSVMKSKFAGLFKIFKKNNAKDDDTKIDDDKKIFNLKTVLHKLVRKKKENDRDNKD